MRVFFILIVFKVDRIILGDFVGPCDSSDGLLGFYKGSENAAVCCSASCGQCKSDQYCSQRPGGRKSCCPGMIRRLSVEKECGPSSPAPCPIRKRCEDWKPISQWRTPYPQSRKLLTNNRLSRSQGLFRVLLFIPCGKKKAHIVADTCQKALAQNISIFLAHYDNSLRWYAETYPEWYPQIQWSVNYKDFKASYIRKELVQNKQFVHVLKTQFSHVWVIDDDIHFPRAPILSHFLRSVQKYDPLIAQPAVHGSWQQLVTPDHQPRGINCPIWSTDFVEVMAPITKTNLLIDIYSRLISQTSNSDWGLDMVWCRYAARRYRDDLSSSERACLIIKPKAMLKNSSSDSYFHKADRVSARPNYFKFYQHSYSTAASLWDKRCIKHNLLPLWAKFQSKCIHPPTDIHNVLINHK